MEDKNPQSLPEYGVTDPTQTQKLVSQDHETKLMIQKTKLRHRLIGGGIIISTLLIALPMLFSEPNVQTTQQAKTRLPAIPSNPFGRLEFPVNSADTSNQPADQVALKDLSQPNVVDDNKRAIVTEPEQTSKNTVEPKNEQQPTPATSDSYFFIQVLATSSEPGAMREMARYQAANVPVYSVKVQKKSATIWRVRLGPFATRAQADKIAQYLDAQKVQHMPVQTEKRAGGQVQKLSTQPTLKTVSKQAAAETAKAPIAQKPKVNQSVSKPKPAPEKKPAVAQPQKVEPVVTKSPKQSTKNKANSSADPLADALKSVRQKNDFIAEQIAKDRAAQQRK